MTSSPEVSVVRQGDGSFRVEVCGLGVTTSHTVNVPEGFADELRWGDAAESELVRESFLFLLERDPPTSILPSFTSVELSCRATRQRTDGCTRRPPD